jgi:hypothetical protein
MLTISVNLSSKEKHQLVRALILARMDAEKSFTFYQHRHQYADMAEHYASEIQIFSSLLDKVERSERHYVLPA